MTRPARTNIATAVLERHALGNGHHPPAGDHTSFGYGNRPPSPMIAFRLVRLVVPKDIGYQCPSGECVERDHLTCITSRLRKLWYLSNRIIDRGRWIALDGVFCLILKSGPIDCTTVQMLVFRSRFRITNTTMLCQFQKMNYCL